MDGISLLPLLKTNGSVPRSKPLVFDWGGLVGIIDNEWKLINKITAGQCDFQVRTHDAATWHYHGTTVVIQGLVSAWSGAIELVSKRDACTAESPGLRSDRRMCDVLWNSNIHIY